MAHPSVLNQATAPRPRVRPLHAVFFFSGVAGLGYQMVWSRMLVTGLGHEMPSVLAVVAAFFGGLALGAWLLDGPISRSRRPGWWYAALETAIGAWGFTSIGLVNSFNGLAIRLIGVEPSFFHQWAVSFAVPLVVLLPATTAMGATLPAMERLVAPLVRGGRCVGGLYAANTAGAVVGTLATTFFIMPRLGYGATLAVLATVNLLCAAAAVLLSPAPDAPTDHPPPAPAAQPAPRWRIGMTVFFTGLLGIGYEALGVRVIAQVLENTIYTFAAVLSVYLLGTAIGAAVYQRYARRVSFTRALGYLLCGLSIACMVGTLLLAAAKPVYAQARKNLFGDDLWGVMASEMVVALMVFGPPTLLMGATFSHLVQAARREEGGVGWAAAINTLGAALAPAVFGVVLLPLIGAKWSLVIVALAYLPLIPRGAGVHWLAKAAPLAVVALLPANLHIVTMLPDDQLIDYRQGVMAAVAVTRDTDGYLSLRVNNRFQMGNTKGAVFECLQGQVPLLLHPHPRQALFLGLGTAITFYTAVFEPGLRADGVELIAEVAQASHYFKPANLPPDADQRLKIYVADARRYVRATDKRYDVIVADLFHPGRDGAGSLYTKEHFQAVRDRLDTGGLFCQWLPLYQLDEDMLRVIVRTYLEVFPNARAYLVDFDLAHPALGLIGSREPRSYPPDWFDRRVHDRVLRAYLKGLLVHDGLRLFGSCVADAESLRQFAGNAQISTDDLPLVTFGAPRFTSQQHATSYGRLRTLLDRCTFAPSQLINTHGQRDGERFVERLSRYVEARNTFFRGLFEGAEGRGPQALDTLVRAVATSDDFTPAYAYCLSLARSEAYKTPTQVKNLLKRLIDAQPNRPDAQAMLTKLFGTD